MATSPIYLLRTSELDSTGFVDLLEQTHIDIVVDGSVADRPGFASETMAGLCAAHGFGYLERGDQLDPAHAGREAFEVSAGAIVELSHAGRVLILDSHDHLAPVLVGHGLDVVELDPDGATRPYQEHLDLS